MATYGYTATSGPVALTAARKTVLQIATPATVIAQIIKASITFDGVTPSAVPALVTVEQQASAGTGGVALLANWGPNPLDPNYPATTVTALRGPWATTEPVMSKVSDGLYLSPTAGIIYQIPLGQEPVVDFSSWFAITVTATAPVNCCANLTWTQ